MSLYYLLRLALQRCLRSINEGAFVFYNFADIVWRAPLVKLRVYWYWKNTLFSTNDIFIIYYTDSLREQAMDAIKMRVTFLSNHKGNINSESACTSLCTTLLLILKLPCVIICNMYCCSTNICSLSIRHDRYHFPPRRELDAEAPEPLSPQHRMTMLRKS